MTIFQSTTASAVEAAIRARIAIDPLARSTVQELESVLVLLQFEDNTLYILFRDGEARVANYSDQEPNMTIVGPVVEIGTTLLTDHNGRVEISGDEMLLTPLRQIFRPSFDAGSLAETVQSTADYGISATKSVIEGFASEFTTNRNYQAQLEELIRQLRELQETVNTHDDRISKLENR